MYGGEYNKFEERLRGIVLLMVAEKVVQNLSIRFIVRGDKFIRNIHLEFSIPCFYFALYFHGIFFTKYSFKYNAILCHIYLIIMQINRICLL